MLICMFPKTLILPSWSWAHVHSSKPSSTNIRLLWKQSSDDISPMSRRDNCCITQPNLSHNFQRNSQIVHRALGLTLLGTLLNLQKCRYSEELPKSLQYLEIKPKKYATSSSNCANTCGRLLASTEILSQFLCHLNIFGPGKGRFC